MFRGWSIVWVVFKIAVRLEWIFYIAGKPDGTARSTVPESNLGLTQQVSDYFGFTD